MTRPACSFGGLSFGGPQVLLLLLLVLLSATTVQCTPFDLYVDCENGEDSNGCGPVDSPCASLAYALSVCTGSNGTGEAAMPPQEENTFCNITILPSVCVIEEGETMLVPENCTIKGLMGKDFTELQLAPATVRDVGFHIPNGRNVRFEGLGFYYNSSRYSKLIFVEEVPLFGLFAILNCSFTCLGNVTEVTAKYPSHERLLSPSEPSIVNFRHSENNGEVHINGTSFTGHIVSLCLDGAGAILLSDCIFENNQVRLMDLIAAAIIIHDTVLRDNYDASVMITMDGESRFVMFDSFVSGNRAQSLVYMGDVSTPTLQSRIALINSTFEYNVASYCVNGVSLDAVILKSNFLHNDLTMLYVTNSNVYIDDSNFINTVSNKSSVTVSIHDDGLSTAPFYALTILDSTFDGNTVTTSGGGVRASAFAKMLSVRVDSTTFSNNHANNGGALMIDGNCVVELYNNTFVDNTASERGSAIFCTSAAGNATVELKNGNVFINNSTSTDDDDGMVSSSSLIYNDPNHSCGIYCTESMEDMCENGAQEYPPAGFTISVLAVLAMTATVTTVIFSAYCYVWVKDVKRFSDYEVVDPE